MAWPLLHQMPWRRRRTTFSARSVYPWRLTCPRRRPWAFGILCLLALNAFDLYAQNSVLRGVDTHISQVELAIKTLALGVNKVIKDEGSFEDRYANAEVMFLLQDYGRTSLLLFELADNNRYRSHKKYSSVLYYLAESQFQLGNHKTARDYFLNLMRYLASQPKLDANRLKFSVKRVTEIAELQHDWQGIDAAVRYFRTAYKGKAPALVVYLDAKSRLRQKRLGGIAQLIKQQIPPQHPIYQKALYLAGVEAVELKRFDEAKNIFNEVAALEDDYDDQEMVKELAAMNEARLLSETQQFEAAIEAYQRVPRESPFFEEALYEVTWVYVVAASTVPSIEEQMAYYEKARRSLEIMLLSESETYLGPEARLLYGNILLKLGDYEASQEAFGEMVQRYEPVRAELARLVTNAQDPDSYYDELLSKRRAGTSILPAMVIKWAEREEGLQGALEVVEDLQRGEDWLQESQEVMERLSAALEENPGPRLLASFRQWESRLNRQEDLLLKENRRLIGLFEQQLGVLDPKVKQELEQARAEFEKLSQGRHGVLSGESVKIMLDRLKEKHKVLFELGWEVEGMNRTALALVQWLESNEGALPEEDLIRYRELLEQARREVDALVREREKVRKELDQVEYKVKAQRNQVSNSFYDRMFTQLNTEFELLRQIASRGIRIDSASEMMRLHTRILASHRELGRLKAKLAEKANAKSVAIRKAIESEQDNVIAYATDAQHMRSQARTAVGAIALNSLKKVEDQFFKIVLRGDVGLVDVSWAAKEAQTQQINTKVAEQKGSIQTLDEEYQNIVQGELSD